MKKIFLISTLCFLSFAHSAAAEMKLAVVDGDKVIISSLAYKSVQAQIEKKLTAYQEEAVKIQDKLMKDSKTIESQKSILSKDAYSKKERAFEAEVAKAQEEMSYKKMSLDKGYSEALRTLESKVTEIVQQKSTEMGFDAVINKASVVYSDAKLDITQVVSEELDKVLPGLAVKIEAAQESTKQKKQ